MKTILLLGAYGMLGSSVAPYLTNAGYRVVRQGRSMKAEIRLDLLDESALGKAIHDLQPDVLINLVAATDVDRCEEDPESAFVANVRTVQCLVRAVEGILNGERPHLIHISTDQVYCGSGPHGEIAAQPCNVYGITKYAGELVATSLGATVLRTNFIGRSRCDNRKSLSDWMVGELRAGRRFAAFDDVLFSPLHVTSLCRVIERAVERGVSGTYNVGSHNGRSKAHLAYRLAHGLGLNESLIKPCSVQSVQLRARRPLDMRLDTSLFEHTFELEVGSVDEQIDLAAKEYLP